MARGTRIVKPAFITLSVLTILIASCSTFGAKSNQDNATNILMPPQKTAATNEAMPIIQPKNDASAVAKSAKLSPQDRIQEKKGDGGEVEEVKVNNINNVPAYYIYPNRSGVDTNAPSSDTVSTPNWKISW
jgi:hypothetical protein